MDALQNMLILEDPDQLATTSSDCLPEASLLSRVHTYTCGALNGVYTSHIKGANAALCTCYPCSSV